MPAADKALCKLDNPRQALRDPIPKPGPLWNHTAARKPSTKITVRRKDYLKLESNSAFKEETGPQPVWGGCVGGRVSDQKSPPRTCSGSGESKTRPTASRGGGNVHRDTIDPPTVSELLRQKQAQGSTYPLIIQPFFVKESRVRKSTTFLPAGICRSREGHTNPLVAKQRAPGKRFLKGPKRQELLSRQKNSNGNGGTR